MKQEYLLFLVSIFLSVTTFSQNPAPIPTFRIDGLIISKARYDSLKLERSSILKIRSMAPTQAASVYGQKASQGVGIITTSKMFLVVSASGASKSVVTSEEKEAMLSALEESQIRTMRNIDAATLKVEFKLDHADGAIVLQLKE